MKTIKKMLFCACCLAAALSAKAFDAKGEEAYTMKRQIINFNTQWLYYPEDLSNGEIFDLDDTNFTQVSIPHANKILEKHKGPDFLSQIDSYRFVSWYRRHFSLPECYSQGDRVIVEFEGVATVARVYVNGNFVTEHKGAYTGFSCDITDYLNQGSNVIAVRVDSMQHKDIPPEGNRVDYCLFGGIVRDVNMIVTGGAYVENTYITTPDLKENSGRFTRINTETTVVNKSGKDMLLSVQTLLLDENGREAAKCVSDEKILPVGESAVFYAQATIDSPHLWDGLDDPYLYRALTRVVAKNMCIDDYSESMGFRWFEFKNDPDDGWFYLNGKKQKLVGINRHEQWPWIGRAVVNKYQASDADLVAETGFNAVRCSHYPQDKAFLNRCDELGLVVLEEAPGWQHVGNAAWKEIYKENIKEMILRDRNHPSIISWGVRVNESDDDNELYAQTNALARKLDPTRPTHGARRQDTYQNSTYYEDIYTAHYIYPEKPVHVPFMVTEHSWDCWTNGFGKSSASDEQALAFTKDFADKVNYYFGNDLCAGGFAWSLFDYDNEVNYTNTDNVFYSGLYDIFRLPKTAANLYISQKDPSKYGANIFIANYWDDDAKPLSVKDVSGDIAQGGASGGAVAVGDEFSVTVMSNCDSVELYVNGEKTSVAPVRKYENLPHPFFVFDGIKYAPGSVTAVGYIDGKEAARYTQKTPGKAAKLILTPDYDSIVADGSDFTSVSVVAVDENGTLVPSCDETVNIEIQGAGKFIGESSVKLEGGKTAFLVQSRYMEAGKVACRATASKMEEGSCEIEVLAFADDGVPAGSASASVKPVKVMHINDSVQSTVLNSFFYSGDGWESGYEGGCYKADNHYSKTAGDVCIVEFAGTNIKWYASKAPNHGIMSISLDGGEEIRVDCYSPQRSDGELIFDSGALTGGVHTLKVTVCGEKNSMATDCYINVDEISIEQTENSTVTESKYSFVSALHSDGKEHYGSVLEWQIFSAPQYFYIDSVDFDKLKSVVIRCGYDIGNAKVSVYAYDDGGLGVSESMLKEFCTDSSPLGESVAEFSTEKTASWGYQSVRMTNTCVTKGEDKQFVLTASKSLCSPVGTGKAALIVGIEGDIGAWGYFDSISLLLEDTQPKKLSFETVARDEENIKFALSAENVSEDDVYTALFNKENKLLSVCKNSFSGSFAADKNEEYILKAFIWKKNSLSPVLSRLEYICKN